MGAYTSTGMRERRSKRSVGMLQHRREVHIFRNREYMTELDADVTIPALSTLMHRVNSSTGS
jgi:hypothetical protein